VGILFGLRMPFGFGDFDGYHNLFETENKPPKIPKRNQRKARKKQRQLGSRKKKKK
jgi:hypothetical protein